MHASHYVQRTEKKPFPKRGHLEFIICHPSFSRTVCVGKEIHSSFSSSFSALGHFSDTLLFPHIYYGGGRVKILPPKEEIRKFPAAAGFIFPYGILLFPSSSFSFPGRIIHLFPAAIERKRKKSRLGEKEYIYIYMWAYVVIKIAKNVLVIKKG